MEDEMYCEKCGSCGEPTKESLCDECKQYEDIN